MGTGRRLLELVLSLAVGTAALWGVLLVVLSGGMSAQHPDPAVPDGDPCCGTPDTWGEVVGGAAMTAGLAVIDGVLIGVAIALVRHAVTERWPRRRWLLLGPPLYAVAAVAAIGVAQVVQP